MKRIQSLRVAFAAVVVFALHTSIFFEKLRAADDQPSIPLPRYKFEVGQQLEYTESYLFEYVLDEKDPEKKGKHEDEYRWTVTVLRINRDKSIRLLLRKSELAKSKSDEENIQIGFLDLHPNGNYSHNDSLKCANSIQ